MNQEHEITTPKLEGAEKIPHRQEAVLPIEKVGEITLTEQDLEELKEWELAETQTRPAPNVRTERPTVAEGREGKKKEKRPLTPEERAAQERRDIEDVIFELGEILGKEVPKISLFLALRDGLDFPTVRNILGAPEKVRALPKEKREELARKISELAVSRFYRNPDLQRVTNIRVPELGQNPQEYAKKLRDTIRADKFKRLEPFFDKLDKERYALEEFFDVQISLE